MSFRLYQKPPQTDKKTPGLFSKLGTDKYNLTSKLADLGVYRNYCIN